jgi:large subunit ribosomal protein L15
MDLKSVTLKGRKHEVRKRIARGLGSGLGKTAGRGHKGWGQRSGASRRPGYEGGQMPLYRRVPKRGFTNARFRTDYTVINVDLLQSFEAGSTVDLDAVLARGLTRKEAPLFKVLGDGELSRALTVRAQKFSKSAAEKIRAAGGTVVELDERGRIRETPAETPAPAPKAPKAKKPEASEAPAGDAKPKKAKKKDDGGGAGGAKG